MQQRRFTRLYVAFPVLFAVVGGADALAGQDIERREIRTGPYVFDALVAGPAGGELVLMLHGFPETSFEFRRQIPVLAAAGYRVVAPDQRGYSPRARPEGVEAYAMGELVSDVIDIADQLGADRFHLVGHDWGGAVAWVTATRHPGRIRTLTVLSTPHFAAFRSAIADAATDQAQRSSYFERFARPGAEREFLADDARFFRSLFAGAGTAADEIQVYVNALGTPAAMRAALNWYSANVSAAASASVTPAPPPTPIRVPTLYVWGDEDVAFGRAAAEATEGFVAGPYRFEILHGVGHWVAEQAADRINALLLEQLKREL